MLLTNCRIFEGVQEIQRTKLSPRKGQTPIKLVWVRVSDNLHYNYWCLWLFGLEHFGHILLQLDYSFWTTYITIISEINWILPQKGRSTSKPLIIAHSYLWLLRPLQATMGGQKPKCDQTFIIQGLGKAYTKGEQHQTDTSREIADLLHPCLSGSSQNWQPWTKYWNWSQWPNKYEENTYQLLFWSLKSTNFVLKHIFQKSKCKSHVSACSILASC